uniref:Uncharacterized protein n=1 Tax=Lepeophtheirus salmonis TaxID=72036 RepID=A0A0K2UBU2_LEPSM
MTMIEQKRTISTTVFPFINMKLLFLSTFCTSLPIFKFGTHFVNFISILNMHTFVRSVDV